MIEAAVFDLGGVLFEEGYRLGLHEIALRSGLDPLQFEMLSDRFILETGYLTGKGSEDDYWEALRLEAGLTESNEEMRQAIIEKFIPREWMMDFVRSLKGRLKLAVLSDQTNWLDILEEKFHFSSLFDIVMNSYYTGRSKVDRSTFDHAASVIGIAPGKIIFIDDRIGNVKRAEECGLAAILFKDKSQFLEEFNRFYPLAALTR
jgi:putative hydrolase of the HAD superfamily